MKAKTLTAKTTGFSVAWLLGLTACGQVVEPVVADSGWSGEDGILEPDLVAAYSSWLQNHALATDAEVDGLYYAYYDVDNDEPWFISSLVSADIMRFLLRNGDLSAALRTADRLLSWQAEGMERVAGAFPSEIAKSATGYEARYLYDSGDTLAVVDGLLDLYEVSVEKRYLDAALAAGRWLRDVMSRGEVYGVWQEAHGVPMKAVTVDGDFDNRIAVGRLLYWLPTLRRLARLSGDESYNDLADAGWGMMSHGQGSAGGFFDHYDPGYPAAPFGPEHFQAFTHDGLVVADDSLRAALGAAHELGTPPTRFVAWLKPTAARIPGYLDFETAAAAVDYDDIISTALYRALCQTLDLPSAEAREFLRHTQSDNGGWYWGWDRTEDQPITVTQSTLTGAWAIADLRPRSF